MDIPEAIENLTEYLKELFIRYVEPHLGTVAKLALAVIIVLFILRIIFPMI